MKWYISGEYFNGKHWLINVESNNDYPHAPWWHTENVSTCHTDYNGTAQIAGFMVHYADQDTEAFKLGLRIVNEAIEALSPKDLQDMHTCTCYIRMKEYIDKAGLTDKVPYEDFYPDEWAISKNWWKGQVIIENLLYLKGFGRI